MFRFEVSDHLTEDAIRIRQEVFVDEQGFVVEFDDRDSVSTHIVLYDGAVPVGVCRIVPESEGLCSIGRVAVSKPYRGRALGSEIMREAEAVARSRGIPEVFVSAQVRAMPFYESLGYIAEGEQYLDEYCPHIRMRKSLRSFRTDHAEVGQRASIALRPLPAAGDAMLQDQSVHAAEAHGVMSQPRFEVFSDRAIVLIAAEPAHEPAGVCVDDEARAAECVDEYRVGGLLPYPSYGKELRAELIRGDIRHTLQVVPVRPEPFGEVAYGGGFRSGEAAWSDQVLQFLAGHRRDAFR